MFSDVLAAFYAAAIVAVLKLELLFMDTAVLRWDAAAAAVVLF